MSEPRIVIFDLEVLADMREVRKRLFRIGDFPGRTLKADINSIICFGWKVLGDENPAQVVSAWDFGPEWAADINNDLLVCLEAQRILADADCIITHNGKRFDRKFLQTRFAKHGISPLAPTHHVDTCAEAKKHLFLFSNSLDSVASFFSTVRKLEHSGFTDLWCRVADREQAAMDHMAEYCKHDVLATEAVFRKLRPLITSLPNYNLFTTPGAKPVCPKCGSTRSHSDGWRTTSTRRYQRLRCMDCLGAYQNDVKLPKAM